MLRKVVVIGPESTGKSTLSAALANELSTVWVPEYARTYLDTLHRPYTEADLLSIANGQLASEDSLSATATNTLICDTDLYVVKVWSEHKYGRCHSHILEAIAARHYDLYLLTYIDIDWQQDHQREHADPAMRQYFYNIYRDIVANSGTPWADVRGSHTQRLQTSLHAIQQLFQ